MAASSWSTSPLTPPAAAGPRLRRALVGSGSIVVIASLVLAWVSPSALSAALGYLFAGSSAIALGLSFGHSLGEPLVLYWARARSTSTTAESAQASARRRV